MANPRIAVVIPARYSSSRFPGKPLADLCGQPMIYHVYQRASKVHGIDQVVVATDDERIHQAVKAFGGNVVMTSSKHLTGTDRVAEAAGQLDAEIVVNVQGDEPLLEPAMITQAVEPVLHDPSVQVTTLMSPVREIAEALDVNVVKLATDLAGDILFFSRASIPYPRERKHYQVKKQIGLYAFRREALAQFSRWSPGPLEATEGVEFFRFLEHGWKVRGVETAYQTIAVDTPADLERVRHQIQRVSKATLPRANHEQVLTGSANPAMHERAKKDI